MLSFDPIPHRYTWNARPVPSVTQCLEPLFDWSAVPPDVLERKRQIGLALHRAIELDLQDRLDESTIDEAVRGYFQAWRAFRAECRFEPTLVEHRVTSDELGEPLRYAGTLDAWGHMQGYPCLVDWKTSLVLNGPAVGAQTAAYLKALVRMGEVGARLSDWRYALKLAGDGRFKLERFRALDTDWQRFVLQLRATSMIRAAA